MNPSDQVPDIVLAVLEASRRGRRQWREEAKRHGLTLEELQARKIADALEGVSVSQPPARYVLTDCSGEHYWNGCDFVPIDAAHLANPDCCHFCSHAEAQAAAVSLREQLQFHLRVLQLDA